MKSGDLESTFYLFFSSSRHIPILHSFPTRRSSDLAGNHARGNQLPGLGEQGVAVFGIERHETAHGPQDFLAIAKKVERSEEHTSELQSRRDLVCRLLLEKKKL